MDVSSLPKTAVFSISAPSGSQSIYIYSGSVSFAADDLSGETSAQAGEAATLLANDSGGTVCSLSTLAATALNDFLIEQVKAANDTLSLCFTDEEIDIVIAERQDELLAIAQEQEAYESELLAQGGNVIISVDEDKDPEGASSSSDTTASSGASNGSSTARQQQYGRR